MSTRPTAAQWLSDRRQRSERDELTLASQLTLALMKELREAIAQARPQSEKAAPKAAYILGFVISIWAAQTTVELLRGRRPAWPPAALLACGQGHPEVVAAAGVVHGV